MNVSCCRPVAAAAAVLVGFAAAFAGVSEEDFTSSPEPQATEYTLRLGEVSFDPLLEAPVVS